MCNTVSLILVSEGFYSYLYCDISERKSTKLQFQSWRKDFQRISLFFFKITFKLATNSCAKQTATQMSKELNISLIYFLASQCWQGQSLLDFIFIYLFSTVSETS